MASNRLAMIDALAKNVPVLDAQAEKQVQAGNAIQMQQALGAAPAVKSTTKAAQTLAPQATAKAAQTSLQSAAQTQATTAALGQEAIQAGATQSANQLATRAIGQQESQAETQAKQQLKLQREQRASNKKLTQAEIDTANRLAEVGIYQENRLLNLSLQQQKDLDKLGRDVKEKIFDDRLRFAQNELGRKFTNERQLADFNISRAQSEIELNNRMREMVQAHNMKMQTLEFAHQAIVQELDQMSKMSEQQKDFELEKRLLKLKRDAEEQMRKEKAKAANTQLIFQGAGMVGGAVVGGLLAGPGGVAAGASLGASVGGGVGTATYGVASQQGWV